MILAQNHLLRLSGNKSLLIVFVLFVFNGCSPKVIPVATKKPEPERKTEKPAEKPVKKFTEAKIALLIPFRLNEINFKTITKPEVEKSAMAIDFYQGFRIGIDSAAAGGLNFKLNVYDTRDDDTQVEELIKNGQLKNADLIVGPVFPQGLKYLRDYAIANHLAVVNPLAASHPGEFNNPNLISIVNNIDLHAKKMGDFIVKSYDPANTVIVLINPNSPEDQIFATPLRNYFNSSKAKFIFQEYASVFTMETKLIKNKKYVVIVTSANREFVIPTLDKLTKLKAAGLLDVDLFGHPDWIRQNYNTDKLQALRTTVTSSYKIDYTDAAVNGFIKKYRSVFHFEPGEYAFKGFDIGFYFGSLLSKYGAGYLSELTTHDYKGLHNNFKFIHDEKTGYINTNLMLVRYENFALNTVE